jgi:crotonobetainyl-CoA:carnitine CoA-transferase CaiB-like acyl-CoA transferase
MRDIDSGAALDQIRVLDLCGPLGQYCGKLLADLGADVIKIEPPQGDRARYLAPFTGDRPDPERSLVFLNYNTNKRSVVLDLDTVEGRGAFLRLLQTADVVLESFAPGTLAGLGLDYAALAAVNPGIVLTSITPFGQTGPYRGFKANDLIGVAMGGMLSINGEPHRPPCTSPLWQAYQMTGVHAAFGTLLALRERERGGTGQHVDVSMQEVEAHMFFNIVNYAATGQVAVRLGERSAIVPNSIYPTRDGHVSLSVFYPHHWRLLAAWLDDPVFADPGWEEREVRRENDDLINARISELTRQFTTADFVAEGQRRHLAVGPVHSIADLAAHPHVIERGLFVALEHPRIGAYRYPRPPFRLSDCAQTYRRPAPLLGEHTGEVLGGPHPPAPAPVVTGAGETRSTVAGRVLPSPVPAEAGTGPGVRAAPLLPLAGVRVIDFSRVWAGPFGARFLADFGADVIRVESGKFPDTRGAVHLPEDVRRERDAHFAEMHRNKRSVTLDLHLPAGRDLARRLVMTADLVLENYAPGVMARWGLGYEDLRAVRPDIIVLSMPGLGGDGPDSAMIAYGQQLMGYLGLSPLWRLPESPLAASSKLAYPDFVAAGQVAVAALAALRHRDRTGRGQFVEVSQLESTASLMGVAFLDYFVNGRVRRAQGNDDPNAAPHGVYRCAGADRWVAIACESDAEWQALCRAMDAPALADEPRFRTKTLRRRRRTELDHLIEAWTRDRAPHAVMHRLQDAGVPAGVVATGADLFHDAHLRARGYLMEIEHPDTGPLVHPGMTVHLAATPGRVRRPAPALGEHNDEIFRGGLGLSGREYQRLVEQGVIA